MKEKLHKLKRWSCRSHRME